MCLLSPVSDKGTGSRERKPDASLYCHPEIDWRWLFAAHQNLLGGCGRSEWGECVISGQKLLNGLALSPEVSAKTLLIPTRKSGANPWSWSGRPVRLLQINPPARSSVGQWSAAGSPDRGRRGMNLGAAPDGGLLSRQGVLSGQRRGGGFRGFPHPPWHKLPEGSRLWHSRPNFLHPRADCHPKQPSLRDGGVKEKSFLLPNLSEIQP